MTGPTTFIEAAEKGVSLRPECKDAMFLDGKSDIIGAIVEGVGAEYSERTDICAKYIVKLPERFPELKVRLKCPVKECDHGEGWLINILGHLQEGHGSDRGKLLQWLRSLKKRKLI